MIKDNYLYLSPAEFMDDQFDCSLNFDADYYLNHSEDEIMPFFLEWLLKGLQFTTKYNIVSNKNISLDGLKGEAAYLVGAISFFETSRRNEEYQMDASECMKLAFHRRIDYLHRKAENG